MVTSGYGSNFSNHKQEVFRPTSFFMLFSKGKQTPIRNLALFPLPLCPWPQNFVNQFNLIKPVMYLYIMDILSL